MKIIEKRWLILFYLHILNEKEKYEIQFIIKLKEYLQWFWELLYIYDDMNNIWMIHYKILELFYLLIMHFDYNKKFLILKYFNDILDYNVDYKKWKKSLKYISIII